MRGVGEKVSGDVDEEVKRKGGGKEEDKSWAGAAMRTTSLTCHRAAV